MLKNNLLKNLSSLFSVNLLVALSGLLSGVFLARVMSVSDRGELAVVLLWCTLVCSFFTDTSREVIFSKKLTAFNITNLAFFSTVLSSLFLLVFFLLNLDNTFAYYVVPFSFLNFYTVAIISKLNLDGSIKQFNLIRLVIPIVYPALLIMNYAFSGNLTLEDALLANLVANICLFFLCFNKNTFNKDDFKLLAFDKDFYFIFFSVVLIALIVNADKLLLSMISSKEEMAYFTVALTFTLTPIIVLSNTVCNYIVSIVKNKNNFLNYLPWLFWGGAFMFVFCLFLLVFLSDYIVIAIYGADYSKSLDYVLISSIISLVYALRQLLICFLRVKEENKIILQINLVILFFSFVVFYMAYTGFLSFYNSLLFYNFLQIIIFISVVHIFDFSEVS